MAGIVFFRSTDRDRVVEFYRQRLGASVWLEQDAGCTILRYDNQLFGFCDGEAAETDGILTFVVEDRETVDAVHDRLADAAREEPHENEAFDIYQFFASDPEGRTVEVQSFDHEIPPVG